MNKSKLTAAIIALGTRIEDGVEKEYSFAGHKFHVNGDTPIDRAIPGVGKNELPYEVDVLDETSAVIYTAIVAVPKDGRKSYRVIEMIMKDRNEKKKSSNKTRRKDKAEFTEKQKTLIQSINAINGLDEAIWVDSIVEHMSIAGMGPMTTGALISTLKEKGVIEVKISDEREKKAKYIIFTERGKEAIRRYVLEG